MAYFIHRERYLTNAVPAKSIMTFPTSVNASSNREAFRYVSPYTKEEMTDEEWKSATVPPTDIVYQASLPVSSIFADDPSFEGAFDIYLPGTYFITWFVSQITGLDDQGQFFQLKYFDGGQWQNFSERSTHLKVSASGGSATLEVTKAILTPHRKITVALFNESNTPLLMNRTSQIKAAIIIFGFPIITSEIWDDIIKEINDLLGGCDGDREEAIKRLKERVIAIQRKDVEQDYKIAELWAYWNELFEKFRRFATPNPGIPSTSDGIPGVRLYSIRTGYTYNFWLEGQCSAVTRDGTVQIFTSDQCEALKFFEHQITGVCYFRNGGSSTHQWLPVIFNKEGIYLVFPQETNILNSSIFKFYQSIVLSDIV